MYFMVSGTFVVRSPIYRIILFPCITSNETGHMTLCFPKVFFTMKGMKCNRDRSFENYTVFWTISDFVHICGICVLMQAK